MKMHQNLNGIQQARLPRLQTALAEQIFRLAQRNGDCRVSCLPVSPVIVELLAKLRILFSVLLLCYAVISRIHHNLADCSISSQINFPR